MKVPLTRRSFVLRITGLFAGLAAVGRGWIGWKAHPGLAATRWTFRAPLTGQVGVLEYHTPGNALDFFGPLNSCVQLFILSDASAVGWGGITAIGNSCSTTLNPTHRCVSFNLATDNFTAISSSAIACHINPTGSIGDLVNGNGGILGIIDGQNAVPGCYDPIHVHYGPGAMTGVGGPWANRTVTVGVDAPWEKFV